MTIQPKIKPCPFCGSDMIIAFTIFKDYSKVFIPQCSIKNCIAGDNGYDTKSPEEATKAWNTRKGEK